SALSASVFYHLSLHDALPIFFFGVVGSSFQKMLVNHNSVFIMVIAFTIRSGCYIECFLPVRKSSFIILVPHQGTVNTMLIFTFLFLWGIIPGLAFYGLCR